MRGLFLSIVIVICISNAHAQVGDVYNQLIGVSKSIGLITSVVNDSSIKAAQKKKHQKKMKYMYRAAQYYKEKDFESALFYINKVSDFKDIDLNNLKYVVKVGSLANSGELRKTVISLNRAIEKVDPENMRLILTEIGKNFTRDQFKKAAGNFFTSSEKEKILDYKYYTPDLPK